MFCLALIIVILLYFKSFCFTSTVLLLESMNRQQEIKSNACNKVILTIHINAKNKPKETRKLYTKKVKKNALN